MRGNKTIIMPICSHFSIDHREKRQTKVLLCFPEGWGCVVTQPQCPLVDKLQVNLLRRKSSRVPQTMSLKQDKCKSKYVQWKYSARFYSCSISCNGFFSRLKKTLTKSSHPLFFPPHQSVFHVSFVISTSKKTAPFPVMWQCPSKVYPGGSYTSVINLRWRRIS